MPLSLYFNSSRMATISDHPSTTVTFSLSSKVSFFKGSFCMSSKGKAILESSPKGDTRRPPPLDLGVESSLGQTNCSLLGELSNMRISGLPFISKLIFLSSSSGVNVIFAKLFDTALTNSTAETARFPREVPRLLEYLSTSSVSESEFVSSRAFNPDLNLRIALFEIALTNVDNGFSSSSESVHSELYLSDDTVDEVVVDDDVDADAESESV
mmetsp:Transcript_4619/g.6429  ORF Transcript_4619/g.6429 Transcript_4619/m.6429 type:complete len:212 (-) Transcript_4619:359-994(-)